MSLTITATSSPFTPAPSQRSSPKMYRAHSKDINRNKSFHPLTYRNLRRVEQLKEEAELNKQKAEERQKELQRDQEERRYDELVLANSADSLSGELARYRQTRSIFAAEYEADAQAAKDAPVASPHSPQVSKPEVQLKTSTGASFPVNSFLRKFKKEESYGSTCVVKSEARDDTAAAASRTVASVEAETSMRKRPRDDAKSNSPSSTHNGSGYGAGATKRRGDGDESAPATGFVTSAEAAQLRKELNLAQKQRHDPLMRVKEFKKMPTLAVAKDYICRLIGKSYTDEEFNDLCFQFGLELDDITSEKEMFMREQGKSAKASVAPAEAPAHLSEEKLYKIDTPANRHDLLTAEGMACALKVFMGTMPLPNYRVLNRANPLYRMTVEKSVKNVRDYVVCAVLHNIRFNERSYNSFIDYQEKLHAGLARRRTLASVGTHDLDKVNTTDFIFACRPRETIRFVPLRQTRELNCSGNGLTQYYAEDRHIGKYVPLISSFPTYPVVYDGTGQNVLSLPPIINSRYSAISVDTRNIFIECTAPDHYKAQVLVNQLVCAFSAYCEDPFTVEAVQVNYEEPTPDGTRSLDVAIAYGYDNIAYVECKTHGPVTQTPLSKVAQLLRTEMACAGYTELLTLSLCSRADAFESLGRVDNDVAAHIANPQTMEFQVCRPSLLPGILKTLATNKSKPLPQRFFECADVVLLDNERNFPPVLELKADYASCGARNQRHLAAAHCNGSSSGFESIHGLTELALLKLGVPSKAEIAEDYEGDYYTLEKGEDGAFFPGRAMDIILHRAGQAVRIGHLGVIHPNTLKAYDIPSPCSYMELNIQFLCVPL
ncbi:B3/4 domain family protein [Leishmania donovani]|uniref:phenylalanine--tRNA ligase n=1 Tax=Leishmania donovani TaxID=5661 RepID=A0A504WYI7_LEIDO|nr:B3/4 domain family protein [Leishmania donovani]